MASKSRNTSSPFDPKQHQIIELPQGFPTAIKNRLLEAGLAHLAPATLKSPPPPKNHEYRNTWELSCGTKPEVYAHNRVPASNDKDYDKALLTCVTCHKSKPIQEYRDRTLLCPHRACSRYDGRARECNRCHIEQPERVFRFYIAFMIKSLRVSLDGYKKYGTAVGIPFTVTIADVLEVYEKQKGLCAVSGEPMTNNQCAFTSAGCMEKANMWIRLVDPKRGVLRHSYDLVRREYAEPQIHNAFSLKARNCYGRRASKASESNQLKPATQVVRVYYEAQFQVPTPTPGLRSILPKASEQPPIGPPAEPLIASPIKSPLEFRNEPPIEPMIEPLTEPLIEPSIEVRVDAIISDWLIDIDESTTPGWLTDLSTEMAESTSDTYIDLSTEMAESTSDTYIDLDLEADQWSTLEQGSVHDPIDAIDAVLSSKEHDTTDTCVSELFGSLFGDQVSELYAPLL